VASEAQPSRGPARRRLPDGAVSPPLWKNAICARRRPRCGPSSPASTPWARGGRRADRV